MIKDLKNKKIILERRLLEETEFKEKLEAQIEELKSKLKDKEDEVISLYEKEKLQKENIQEMIKRLTSAPLKESSDSDTQPDGTFTASDEAREKAIQEAIESCKSEIYAEMIYESFLSSLKCQYNLRQNGFACMGVSFCQKACMM
ncbi:hypothetical protein Anas_05363 [Armadillidium nasatum]|uniref:Uncharacterized protein n=1 Tax=Armadillidium nasatum TaxID=96803 RepID=A0A5N5T173_9CRUS|nr:hypothetical protein Anas_05363 [Armadillidium nasatum]